jgi:argininosuccinate lyase
LLGFDAATGNTYGSIAAVDYLLEAAAAAGVMLVGVGRLVQGASRGLVRARRRPTRRTAVG